MDSNSIIAICTAATIVFSIATPAIAQAITAKQAFLTISRQPETASDIRTMLILALGFIEALTIYGLLIAFMLVGKIA